MLSAGASFAPQTLSRDRWVFDRARTKAAGIAPRGRRPPENRFSTEAAAHISIQSRRLSHDEPGPQGKNRR